MDQWLAWIAGISSKCKLWFSCPSRLKIHMSATAQSVVLVFPPWDTGLDDTRALACMLLHWYSWLTLRQQHHPWCNHGYSLQITQFRARWKPTTSYVAHTSSVYLSLSIYIWCSYAFIMKWYVIMSFRLLKHTIQSNTFTISRGN